MIFRNSHLFSWNPASLPPPNIGNMDFVFTKTTRVATLPANSGTFTTSNFWTCAGTPHKQWETFMSSFNGVVKELQVSQEKSHNQAVNSLLVTVIQEAQSWQSIWVNMVLLAVSWLQPAGCRLEVGGNPKLSLFFCVLGFARLTTSGRNLKGWALNLLQLVLMYLYCKNHWWCSCCQTLREVWEVKFTLFGHRWFDAFQGLRAAVAVSCPLAYPAHQAELEKRTLVFCVCGMRCTATFGEGFFGGVLGCTVINKSEEGMIFFWVGILTRIKNVLRFTWYDFPSWMLLLSTSPQAELPQKRDIFCKPELAEHPKNPEHGPKMDGSSTMQAKFWLNNSALSNEIEWAEIPQHEYFLSTLKTFVVHLFILRTPFP